MSNAVQAYEIRTANKQHECSGCDEPILPGQQYRRTAVLLTHEVDEDGNGGIVAIELDRSERKWFVSKSHLHHEPEPWL